MSEANLDIQRSIGMYGSSLKGKRELDEDFVACGGNDSIKVGVLCDGMGGNEKGDVASKITARGFLKGVMTAYSNSGINWSSERYRHGAYSKLIQKSHDIVKEMSGGPGISGTTITAVVITHRKGGGPFSDIIHMGDSRCYALEDGIADLITDDHSITGDMFRSGYIEIHEIPKTSGSNVITRNIGDKESSVADVNTIASDELEGFLVCCDGVWDPLHGKDGLWLPPSPLFSQASAEKMVKKAISRGSTDNCSVLLIDNRY